MWVLPRAFARLRSILGLSDLLLLVWFALYLLLFVQPRLIYQESGPVFSLAPGFLGLFLRYSGGPVEYASRFLAQLDALGWPGAAVRVAEALLISALAGAYFARVGGRPARAARFVPVVLFMLASGQYFLPQATGPALVATLAAAALFAAARCKTRPARFAAYSLLAGALYYAAAGAPGKLGVVLLPAVFALLCLAAEARRGGGWKTVLWGAAALALPAAVVFVGEKHVLTGNPYGWAVWRAVAPTWANRLAIASFASLPVAAGACAVAAWLVERRRAGEVVEQKRAVRRGSPRWAVLGALALVWGVNFAATNVTADRDAGRRAQEDYCVTHGEWRQVLRASAADPNARGAIPCFDVNLALFHLGRLSDDMFAYDQRPDGILLPMGLPQRLPDRLRLADQYLSLGRVNEAEEALHNTLPSADRYLTLGRVDEAREALHNTLPAAGENPELLRRLAMVYLVRQDLPAARLVLNHLRFDLLQGKWAREKLAALENDPQLSSDQEVQALRAVMLPTDDLLTVSNIEEGDEQTQYYPDRKLLGLLDAHPRNRMALEYLMALYLLLGRPDMLAEQLHRFDAFPDKRIPRSWEEGLLLAMSGPNPKVDLHGRTISPETLKRFERFRQIIAESGGVQQAYPVLQRECAGSYFLYFARLRVGQ